MLKPRRSFPLMSGASLHSVFFQEDIGMLLFQINKMSEKTLASFANFHSY